MTMYTAIEAARELGISEKTIRRWIDAGKLQAHKTTGGNYAIPESEIARLRLEREQDGVQPDQAARLEAIEAKYNDLEARYSRLVARVAALEETRPSASSAAYIAPGPVRERKPRQPAGALQLEYDSATVAGVPDGAILYADFANMHGLNPHTFRDHLTIGIGRGDGEKDRVEHIERPIPNRRESERWLSPEQQYKAILFWQKYNKKYTPCSSCPHAVEQVSVTEETTAQEADSAAIEQADL